MTGGLARTLNRTWIGISERDRMLRVVQPGLLGLTDGTLTEIVEGDVKDGTKVVTNDGRPAAGAGEATTNPFAPSFWGRRGKKE